MAVGGCCSGNAGPVAGAGEVEGGFEVAGFVVSGVEGELVDGLLGRDQPFGAERNCADTGTLEAEEGQEFTAGGTEVGGVGGRFDEGSGARGARPICVGDGQRDRLGDALLVAEPGTELLDETEDGAVVLVRVELVAVEPARSTDRFRRDSWDDGTVVLAVGTVVTPYVSRRTGSRSGCG